jgi:DNA transformation protein
LQEREPLAVFQDLADVMGRRHDPCVLYTLLAARAFLDKGEERPWWEFTAEGKRLLKQASNQGA